MDNRVSASLQSIHDPLPKIPALYQHIIGIMPKGCYIRYVRYISDNCCISYVYGLNQPEKPVNVPNVQSVLPFFFDAV
ncbi:MAG TPA: hypothetical protein VGL94_22175 [Ktedonobacteraceae bacterium]|jgi:hypothetical protein